MYTRSSHHSQSIPSSFARLRHGNILDSKISGKFGEKDEHCGGGKMFQHLVPMRLQILEANRNENAAEASGPHLIVTDSTGDAWTS